MSIFPLPSSCDHEVKSVATDFGVGRWRFLWLNQAFSSVKYSLIDALIADRSVPDVITEQSSAYGLCRCLEKEMGVCSCRCSIVMARARRLGILLLLCSCSWICGCGIQRKISFLLGNYIFSVCMCWWWVSHTFALKGFDDIPCRRLLISLLQLGLYDLAGAVYLVRLIFSGWFGEALLWWSVAS